MNLVDRAKKILLQPKQEWPVIDAEPMHVQDIYTQYVMILAAIPALAGFIGMSLIGYGMLGVSYRVPIGMGLAHMIVSYLLSLGMVYLLALLVDAMAPSFGGTKDFIRALKVVAFSCTAAWLAGIFAILPALSILGLLGLYSFYLLYTGLGPLMKVPEDKVIPYIVVIVIAAIVLNVLIMAIAGMAIPGSVRGF
jgi:hypothetical protein